MQITQVAHKGDSCVELKLETQTVTAIDLLLDLFFPSFRILDSTLQYCFCFFVIEFV